MADRQEPQELVAKIIAKTEKQDKNQDYYWQFELQKGEAKPLTYRYFDDYEAGKEPRAGETWRFSYTAIQGEKGGTFRNIKSILERMTDVPVEAPRSLAQGTNGNEHGTTATMGRESLMARESALKSAVSWCGAVVGKKGGLEEIKTVDVLRVAEAFLGWINGKPAPQKEEP